MAPLQGFVENDELLDLFGCGICNDIMLDATTLVCCGKSFCRGCLRQWIRTSVHSAGVPRCPGGCCSKMPIRLPARSHALTRAMEQLVPEAYEERRRQEEEEADTGEELCYGGFKAWQEVAAARDVIFGSKIGVRQGTPGVLIGNFTDGCHVTVRFDHREDDSELCVNVLPEALMDPLPGGFRLGQRVVALFDLLLNEKIGVKLGTAGTVVGRLGEDRLMICFDERLDAGEGTVSVNFREVTLQRLLVGGFKISQKVQSAMDLVVGSKVVVKAGTLGVVLAEFSETRLTVSFDQAEGGSQSCFNVLPVEIKTWCEPPEDLPIGSSVQATKDLVNMNSLGAPVVVRAGTKGVVVGGVDETQVLVRFETNEDEGVPPQTLTVEFNSVQKSDY
mmetsp:Transcript_6722/g.16680  ORF Transcript_6722/g.16680 Transcript_6722/m.16680 type:complete len:390 (-) Transcript_6722:243-1412(-)|eukprot:CAMPEP_0117499454 /NCGR_PEP_ID=MMETSP0784-20121206/22254_1 /TAXON_ID=39447 /ORGANISM="" /LENGTH=389 /DNA_ID=CAMNT_0005294603 /DNA_START=85 /DNA_END=1254 /DNA_ORIENTATION=-